MFAQVNGLTVQQEHPAAVEALKYDSWMHVRAACVRGASQSAFTRCVRLLHCMTGHSRCSHRRRQTRFFCAQGPSGTSERALSNRFSREGPRFKAPKVLEKLLHGKVIEEDMHHGMKVFPTGGQR